jgi:pimeloyl-ACP methyl ester carboxylesterase
MAVRGDAALANHKTAHVFRGKDSSLPSVITKDGVGLFYRDWGTGTPIVFLAPWGLHSDCWEYQMAYLAGQGFRCIAYDRRGHGRSAEPANGYEFDTLADDLNAVIEQLDLQGATLIGQSLGCGEIVRYLSRHGSRRLARMVLVAPITPLLLKTTDNPDGIESVYLEKVREVLSTDRAHAIAAAAPAYFGSNNPVSPEMMDWFVKMLLQCSLRVLLDLQRMFTRTDFRHELTEISLPTLIIQGDNDNSCPIDLTGRRTAGLIRGSQLKVYEGAAHGLALTHMHRLNRDLAEFIR